MTKYPIGLQDFQGLREDGYVYVDKTAFIDKMVKSGKYYFLSRPRRFGKSLLVTTLEAYFEGKEELFKGLVMEKIEKDYQVMGDTEIYFHNVTSLVFKLLGFYDDVERHTTDGRMDMLVQTKDYIYIFEFKIDKSADEALQQIEEKQYAKPFEQDLRKLYKIGVNFSSESRRMESWKVI